MQSPKPIFELSATGSPIESDSYNAHVSLGWWVSCGNKNAFMAVSIPFHLGTRGWFMFQIDL